MGLMDLLRDSDNSSSRSGFSHVLDYSYESVPTFTLREDFSEWLDVKALMGDPDLSLRKEPRNEYDNKAIAIYWHNHRIAYLLKGKLQGMAHDYMNRRGTISAQFDNLIYETGHFEILINLQFYS